MSTVGIEMGTECLENLTEAEKIAFLRAFSKMASVDGNFDDNEKAFVRNAAAEFGINSEKTEEILQNLDAHKIIDEVKIIKDRSVALELIKELCILAHADNNLSDEEVLFIGEVGEATGIELEKIEEISRWIIEYLVWQEKGRIIFEQV